MHTVDALSAQIDNEKRLTDDFEWRQAIETFTQSSNRGRYLMIVIVFASFFCAISWLSAREDSWIAARVVHARRAIQCETWNVAPAKGSICSAEEFAALKEWSRKYELHNRELLFSYLTRLEEMESQSAYSVRIPVIGVAFDINDLGTVAGLSFLFLLLALLASTYREHENLFLLLWKIRRVADAEGRLGDGLSQANLLYHSLAMAQVLANPPTLARWKRNRLYYLPYVIFFLPLIPLTLILVNDLGTTFRARPLNPAATYTSLSIQAASLAVCLLLAFSCVLYERACALRWGATFDHLNPQYKNTDQPLVRDWLFLGGHLPTAGDTASDRMLFSGREFNLRELLSEKARLLIFESPKLRSLDQQRIDRILDECRMGLDQVCRIAVDRASRESGRHFAPRRFLSAWRVRHIAVALVDTKGSIRLLGWRWGRLDPVHGVAEGAGEIAGGTADSASSPAAASALAPCHAGDRDDAVSAAGTEI